MGPYGRQPKSVTNKYLIAKPHWPLASYQDSELKKKVTDGNLERQRHFKKTKKEIQLDV